ncbi:hypothetical protein HBI56_135200 [Parastagonospora nodorum]|uniref:Uncharacterized protein n=1 Tax=Phaeosphaeria nodorum (strain SN15 / ATCC MYA-4574 / FGSC 10173) TaxID=321614 RepID=A0A7U2F933_PHANO|nr:hypothetical protein HBH56_038300 [Parastagonospora nodorum]QRC99873.1 hypothetical protein JI435_414170 [Parastagonospora nodorum SN15]KAH3933601.1 hypothetical protein HBH54_061160 [Parastagonospora nodorum]KAH3952671.1 hypothetical protein HBH53_048950 [Parastagonospora nodorum]KAH3979566.1 hypothetical protein HBH51_059960 [Parastagonospora nodorum]
MCVALMCHNTCNYVRNRQHNHFPYATERLGVIAAPCQGRRASRCSQSWDSSGMICERRICLRGLSLELQSRHCTQDSRLSKVFCWTCRDAVWSFGLGSAL